jgi:DNA-binding LacI/PurR family transcriptional regulator
MDRPPGSIQADTILIDNVGGARQATEHLLAHGHRRIGMVGDLPRIFTAAERYQGYAETMKAAGIGVDELLVKLGPHDVAAAETATRELLGLPDPPTAIVYGNDLMAIAGMGVALEAGLEVPSELSVVGFDDVPLAAHVTPPLTTVRQDALAWGEAAARTLLAVVERQAVPAVQLDLPQLIVRASTAAPRQPKGRR